MKLAITMLAFALWGCGDSGALGRPDCEDHIGLIGDSNTSRPGWPELLEEEYWTRRHAAPGTTTANWIPGTNLHESQDFKACTYILFLGTNNAGSNPSTSKDQYIKEILAIANDLIGSHGAREIFIVSPPPIFGRGRFYARANVALAEYDERIKDLCTRSRSEIQCGPDLMRGAIRSDFEGDGIHLNEMGAEWVFELMLARLEGQN